ncbi:hypothetical protein D3C81_2142980 [compost metagenome]
MADHAQVVADEQIRQVQVVAQLFKQVQHLRLNRHIQGGHGFIADDHGRLERQRPRDADALALPA